MKNFQKGFAPLVILIIVAVIGVGGGTYVVVNNKQKAEVKTNVSTEADIQASSTVKNTAPATTTKSDNKTITVKATTTVKVTLPVIKKGVYVVSQANGQVTYKSDEYGFQFTLPADFKVETVTNGKTHIFFATEGSYRRIFRIYLDQKLTITKAGYLNVPSGVGGSTYVETPWDVTIGNKAAQRFYQAGDICLAAQNYQLDVKDAASKNVNAVISFWGGNCVTQGLTQDFVDSVLASFKFTK